MNYIEKVIPKTTAVERRQRAEFERRLQRATLDGAIESLKRSTMQAEAMPRAALRQWAVDLRGQASAIERRDPVSAMTRRAMAAQLEGGVVKASLLRAFPRLKRPIARLVGVGLVRIDSKS